jgi:Holliday junction resolvase-like predicted endonuclease
MLLSLRHSDKIKTPSAMRNSSARERRVAEACWEKLMDIGTCAGRATFSLQKIICRRAPRANWTLWDTMGETIAFVEIRTRTVRKDISGMPELSVSYAKQSVLVRTAQRFLADRHLHDCPTRFDELAIGNIPGPPPEIRLHQDAFSPQLRRSR